MVYQIELETTVSITEFINAEGQLFFSKDAFHSIRKIKPDILFRRTFILKNTDGKNYCCYHDDKTIYFFHNSIIFTHFICAYYCFFIVIKIS